MTDIITLSLKIPLNDFEFGRTKIQIPTELVGYEVNMFRINFVYTDDDQLEYFDLKITPFMDTGETIYYIDKTMPDNVFMRGRLIGKYGKQNTKFIESNCLFPNSIDISLLNIDGSYITTPNVNHLFINFDVQIMKENVNKYAKVISL